MFEKGLLGYGTRDTTNLMITALRFKMLGGKAPQHTLCCQPSTSSLARSVFGDPLVERHHI